MVAVQAETARVAVPGMPAAGAERLRAIGDTATGTGGSGTAGTGLPGRGLTAPGLTAPDLTGPGLTAPGLTAPGLTGPSRPRRDRWKLGLARVAPRNYAPANS
ncbi:hypothetical protein [Microbispora sitophila]|uniref:hypothetical protein n=1 Tax=Microbispora sitophila TaxID=2771537 RepID=UPI0021F6E590|nr:hypothetical protein [Microbispora sitophila]